MFFIVALLLCAATLLYFLFPSGETSVTLGDDPQTTKLRNELRAVTELNQQLTTDVEKLLSDVRFQELSQFGTLPVTVGETGKANPFQP